MPPAGNIRPIADDQIIDAVIARSIQTDAERTHPMLAWVIIRDEEFCPGQFMARLVTNTLTPLADTLGELHAQLPPRLERSDRQPVDRYLGSIGQVRNFITVDTRLATAASC
jgi:hypothetical protein